MNNQEVKRSLYRLQNVNNLPKLYSYVLDLPISCRVVQLLIISLVELQEYIYSIL